MLGHDSLREKVADDGAQFEPLRSALQYDPRPSVAEIGDAVATTLADRRAGEAAVAFAASVGEHPGVEDAIVAIEDLI